MKASYSVYELTIDEETGDEVRRLRQFDAPSFAEAARLLAENPRCSGIDFFDGKEWHYDVKGEFEPGPEA